MNGDYLNRFEEYYTEKLKSIIPKNRICKSCKKSKVFKVIKRKNHLYLQYNCNGKGECNTQLIGLPNYINYPEQIDLFNKLINDNLNVDKLINNKIEIKNSKHIKKTIDKSIRERMNLQEQFHNTNRIDEIESDIKKTIQERNRLYKKCEQLKHKLKTNLQATN